jgi:hypothetical protein
MIACGKKEEVEVIPPYKIVFFAHVSLNFYTVTPP